MKMKIIQVGLGAHGRGVGSTFIVPSPDFAYAGLVDLNVSALESFAEEHKLPQDLIRSDYRKAFRELEADAVFISAISPVHYEIAKDALENGLHVLIEKPFVLNMEEALELVQLASVRHRSLMISQNYRYLSSVLTLKQAMGKETLGSMRFVRAEFFYDHDGKGYQREMDDYILLEMSVHHIDMIRFLLDSDITGVRGMTWNDPDSGYRGDPHVNAAYRTGKGVPVFYTASLLAKGPWIPWEGAWRIQFENGAVFLDDLGEGYGVYLAEGGEAPSKLPSFVPEREGIHGVLAEFARSIRENREPAVSGRDNLNTLEALLATARSSREGKEISLRA